jgi:hypothetical protein
MWLSWALCFLAGGLIKRPVTLTLAVVLPILAIPPQFSAWWWWPCAFLGLLTLFVLWKLLRVLFALSSAWRPELADPFVWTNRFAFMQGQQIGYRERTA